MFRRDGPDAKEGVPMLHTYVLKPDIVLIRFELHAVCIPKTAAVRLIGSTPALGEWKVEGAPKMFQRDFPVWKYDLVIPRSQLPFSYKYIFTDSLGNKTWEEGSDHLCDQTKADIVLIQDGSFRRELQPKAAGVAIPIFSLRSKDGLGIGEFLDLKGMVDFAKKSGLKVIQILPINDTSVRGDWRDSYPYSSLSVCALHPIYLRLDHLTKDAKILQEIQSEKIILNSYPKVDYEAVFKLKMRLLKSIFEQTKKEALSAPDFESWFKKNKVWLVPYALFCVFKDQYGTSDFTLWKEYSMITMSQVEELTASNSKYYNQVSFIYYIQYNLHKQLKEASAYAEENGVGIKGDIAIGVNPRSVDTWVFPKLFRMDKSTGAPPDMFSETGQNWGFPTYNWDEMAKDDFSWWKMRLNHMAQYFHAFRIDHILGFFRIWEIPRHCIGGLLGRFFPSIPINRSELESHGLWDVNRLCEPYVRTHLLQDYFGGEHSKIQGEYFDEIGWNAYKFKDQFKAEKKIDAALPTDRSSGLSEDKISHNRWIKSGLFKLLQNVCFLRDSEDPNLFYPRIEMSKTSSFQELGDGKEALTRIYVDYFYNRQEGFWTTVAFRRLPVMINSTKMLCCGEDLGMVPKCVEPVMNHLKILGLRIQRMPSDPKIEFYHPEDYPYMTVCTPSVHDTSTLRGWWEEDYPTTQRFYNQILGIQGAAPKFCEAWITERVINQHLYCRSMLTVIPLQDFFGLEPKYFANKDPREERINEPSNPEHYWRFRMHVPVEELAKDEIFTNRIFNMLADSGRI